MAIKIDHTKCCWKDGKPAKCSKGKACTDCIDTCPVGALTFNQKVILDANACIDCGACISACQYKAISTK